MAAVIITREQAEYDQLPHICLRCGNPATVRQDKTFSKRQEWTSSILLGGLPSLLLGLVFRDRMAVRVPLCDKHKHHFHWQTGILWGGLAVVLTLLFACFAMIGNVPDKIMENSFIGVGAFALFWVVVLLINQLSGIAPAKIDSHQALIMGVSEKFVRACERRRGSEEAEEAPWLANA